MKARKMWATFPKGTSLEIYHMKSEAAENASEWRMNGHDGCHEFPVAVLDVSDPEALVEQVARALYVHFNGNPESFPDKCGPITANSFLDKARVVLESLGILPTKRKSP